MIVAGYISHPRWLEVLLFPDRVGNNMCQGSRQSDENITIYFPIIIITSSQAGTWLIQYRKISFVWISFKPRNIMTEVNIPINHFLDFIGRHRNNHFVYQTKFTQIPAHTVHQFFCPFFISCTLSFSHFLKIAINWKLFMWKLMILRNSAHTSSIAGNK